MNPLEMTPSSDASLVTECLAGNREAFGEIVARYQTLICSLAYSGTGSLSQSEDLAQETFIAAWKQLASLREPRKLRGWLCGITRNLIYDALAKQGREPSHAAEPLEAIRESSAPEPPAHRLAISHEEAAILWRSLERLPEMYREPLILFYREHQSVGAVALNLDLSEDAVKQRLSRGQKSLQAQVLAFVAGALGRTNPGPAFTFGVLTALPAMVISARAATVGAAAKGAGLLGLGGAMVTPLAALVGMWTDVCLKRKGGQSERELHSLKSYYSGIAVSVVVVALLFTALLTYGGSLVRTKPMWFAGLMIGLIVGYSQVIAALARRFNRDERKREAERMPREVTAGAQSPLWEYRSRFELLGLPFIHLRFGGWFGGRSKGRPPGAGKPVKAWIAITDAFGIGVLFAYGGRAIAPVSVGACAVGLFSFGGLAVGALAVGGFGFGIWALAPFAVGWQAFGGGCAIAWNAAWGGHFAIAHRFALGEVANAARANDAFVRHVLTGNAFFRFCGAKMTFARMIAIIWMWAIPLMISQFTQGWVVARRDRRSGRQMGHRNHESW